MKTILPALLLSCVFLTAGCPEKAAPKEASTPPPAPMGEAKPAAEPAAPAPAAARAAPTTPEEALLAAREATKTFGGELKKALFKALGEGGPTAAIPVCNEQAPALAEKLSAEQKVLIRRVTERRRNAANAPDAWEQKVLEAFARPIPQSGKVEVQEHWEVVEEGGKKQLRYARSILVGEGCLKCHGKEIAPEVKTELAKLYPADAAIGYAAGELRGIFSATVDLP
ncbi:MAG: DUF3365 domain-containing protein [Deltaproteobacteria bacterium]|nr:DUF3365 domain-containing protein [Deltaproteobacteria bacterium]